MVVSAVVVKVENVAVPKTGEHGPSLVICEEEMSDMVVQGVVRDKLEIKQYEIQMHREQQDYKQVVVIRFTQFFVVFVVVSVVGEGK